MRFAQVRPEFAPGEVRTFALSRPYGITVGRGGEGTGHRFPVRSARGEGEPAKTLLPLLAIQPPPFTPAPRQTSTLRGAGRGAK